MRINSRLKLEQDSFLLGLELDADTLQMFTNITHVLLQGSAERSLELAKVIAKEIYQIDERFFMPINLTASSNFNVYRVGSVLCVSHGMGNVTMECLLHAITKVLHFAGNNHVEYIRIGTSGGIDISAGSVIITQKTYMPTLENYYVINELDKTICVPSNFDFALATRVYNAQPNNLKYSVILGNTIAADDFYLGQCRYDGAMPAREDKSQRTEYFIKARNLGIYNFEMESSAMSAFCAQAQIPATMIAVTLVNRFDGDQITSSVEQLAEYAKRAQSVALNYIKQALINV